MAKVDAHVITKEEYDEIPELTMEDFDRGVLKIGDRVVDADEFRAAVRKAIGQNVGRRVRYKSTLRKPLRSPKRKRA